MIAVGQELGTPRGDSAGLVVLTSPHLCSLALIYMTVMQRPIVGKLTSGELVLLVELLACLGARSLRDSAGRSARSG